MNPHPFRLSLSIFAILAIVVLAFPLEASGTAPMGLDPTLFALLEKGGFLAVAWFLIHKLVTRCDNLCSRMDELLAREEADQAGVPKPPARKRGPISKLVVALLLAVPLLGLFGCVSPETAYVNADRKTYDHIGPAFRAYTDADPSLDAEDKALNHAVLDTWALRIARAERREKAKE